MGKKNSELSKYREWERERRERLNVSFKDLGSLLPNHDPAVSTSKVDILQKSSAYIRDLKKENSELLLGGANKIQTKKIKRLQRYVEALLLRVQQLAKLLRDAGISPPPEPPTITPLGEKTLRWSNKLSPKEAERALEAEKVAKSVNQKKTRLTKKDTSSSKDKNGVPAKCSNNLENPSSSSKNPGTTETSSPVNKLRSSPQKADKEFPKIPAPKADRPPQENGSTLPVGQLFGDTSRILTSIPPHVVGADQQPGIIVIRTTGANTLGAVTQQSPQSTCFVIDNGNCSSVNSGQASAIVASHPPTLEARPTFVLASNGSLLPVLPASQFVAQPRQLIVSTSSPVPVTKQSLTPIAFKPSVSNSQCLKPLNRPLREVKCSQSVSGDISQLKKVPIPALPRNKQKPPSCSKEVAESPGKSASKKKCVSASNETSKTNKGINSKTCEKKNSKSPTDNSPQEKSATPNIFLPQNNISVSQEEEALQGKQDSSVPVCNKSPINDNSADSRKRELPEPCNEDNNQPKKKRVENSPKNNECAPHTREDTMSTVSLPGDSNPENPLCNAELIHSTSYSSPTGSVSSYSIDALCKMNEKISVHDSVGSMRDIISSRKQKNSHGTSSPNDGKDQLVESNCQIPTKSTVSESTSKSLSGIDTGDIKPGEGEKLASVGNKSAEPLREVNRETVIPAYASAEHSSQPEAEMNIAGHQSSIPSSTIDIISHNVEASSPKNAKDNPAVNCEEKGKDNDQSPILPTFGVSPSFPQTSDESYRKEEGERVSNCANSQMDESSLPPGAFSSDLFASLQVPSGHSESISPTAAFLLAFPLVSTLTGKTPDLGSESHPSQPLASVDNGSGDNDLSSGGCGGSFLQLGNLEDTSPSSTSQSILSSLTPSSSSSSQTTIHHLKPASAIHSLMSRSVENDYGRASLETDIQLVERQITSAKDVSLKSVTSKDTSHVTPLSSSGESCVNERNSTHKEMNPSTNRIELVTSKSHYSKESESECINTLSREVPSRDAVDVSNMSHSSLAQKSPHQDNSSSDICAENNREPVTAGSDKVNINTSQSQHFEADGSKDSNKKNGSENRTFPTSDQQYISYQLPQISCSSADLPEPQSNNACVVPSMEVSNSNGVLRQEGQTLDHTVTPTASQDQSSLSFQNINHHYKSGETRTVSSKEIQARDNNFSSSYSLANPSTSHPSPVSSTSCFTISSFTSSLSSAVSNSLLSSCVVTNSSPSFSSPNSTPLLMTSSSCSSSVAFPTHSNALYSNGSSSCIAPIYSSSLTQSLCTSTASFPNPSFAAVPVSVTSTAPVTRTVESSKNSVSSNISNSPAHNYAYGNSQNSVLSNLLPTSFVNSASAAIYDSTQKNNSQPVSTSEQHCNLPLKESSVSVEQKSHNQGSTSSIHPHPSEAMKSHNIFSVDHLNSQSYSYNFSDYPSHMPSYMPQKPELEMMAKKPSNQSTETPGGNLTSRMPGSFSVAHNSSNFSILSWTTLSPMSAAPSSSLDSPGNNVNGRVDAYSSSPGSLGLSSNENASSSAGKVSDSNASSSFPQTVLPESREIPSSYPQYPVGNNNVGTELSGLTGFPVPQDVGKQCTSRGHALKPRQQVTNWMTAPDPIHSSSDFTHNNDAVRNEHLQDAFGSSGVSYGSNPGFYSHHTQNDMPYASSSNSSIGNNAMLDVRNGAQSVTTGTNRNSHKECSTISDASSPSGENILHLQPKPSDPQQNQVSSCAYNKMANSSTGYIHNSQSELPALPTLVGDLALGSCNSVKGFLPIYDETSASTSKPGKHDIGKVQSNHSSVVSCSSILTAKENRDGRNTSTNNEYGGSSFLSVSQLVDHIKDSSHQNQPRENDRSGGEKARNRDANKTAPASRRNVRQSNVKRDGTMTNKEQQGLSQIHHSRTSSHSTPTFANQGISPSVVSSNPTHLHAPPIPFPPYKSVHWPVNEMTKPSDNTLRNGANYKSSSSYSAEALIRPSLTTTAIDSRLADVEMPAYGMDIHKYPIPGGRSDHLFADFVDSNVIGNSMENVSLQQNHLKQNSQDHRQVNDNFRSGHHSNCDKFNYSSNAAPSTFPSHHHVPPSFGNNEDYSLESGNHTSSMGLSANCMEFAPFSHPKEGGPITSSVSSVCSSIGYNSPTNDSICVAQNQSQSCRSQEGKTSMRTSSGNCEKACGGSLSGMQVGASKPECTAEGSGKQSSKESGVSHNSQTIPPFLPMESNSTPYISHHYPPHNHCHHNPTTQYPSGHVMDAPTVTPLNNTEHQAPKLFPRFPPPTSGVSQMSHQSSATNSSMGSGITSGGHLSSGTLTNFNLSTIFPEINDKQNHHSHMASSTTSFEVSSKNGKLSSNSSVTSTASILHPPSPLPPSYHHYRPHQHNHQAFPSTVDLGNRIPPPHPSSGVLHSNVSFNNLMVQSTPQVNGIAINSPLQPPPPPFSAPSFANVLPGL